MKGRNTKKDVGMNRWVALLLTLATPELCSRPGDAAELSLTGRIKAERQPVLECRILPPAAAAEMTNLVIERTADTGVETNFCPLAPGRDGLLVWKDSTVEPGSTYRYRVLCTGEDYATSCQQVFAVPRADDPVPLPREQPLTVTAMARWLMMGSGILTLSAAPSEPGGTFRWEAVDPDAAPLLYAYRDRAVVAVHVGGVCGTWRVVYTLKGERAEDFCSIVTYEWRGGIGFSPAEPDAAALFQTQQQDFYEWFRGPAAQDQLRYQIRCAFGPHATATAGESQRLLEDVGPAAAPPLFEAWVQLGRSGDLRDFGCSARAAAASGTPCNVANERLRVALMATAADPLLALDRLLPAAWTSGDRRTLVSCLREAGNRLRKQKQKPDSKALAWVAQLLNAPDDYVRLDAILFLGGFYTIGQRQEIFARLPAERSPRLRFLIGRVTKGGALPENEEIRLRATHADILPSNLVGPEERALAERLVAELAAKLAALPEPARVAIRTQMGPTSKAEITSVVPSGCGIYELMCLWPACGPALCRRLADPSIGAEEEAVLGFILTTLRPHALPAAVKEAFLERYGAQSDADKEAYLGRTSRILQAVWYSLDAREPIAKFVEACRWTSTGSGAAK